MLYRIDYNMGMRVSVSRTISIACMDFAAATLYIVCGVSLVFFCAVAADLRGNVDIICIMFFDASYASVCTIINRAR